MDVTLSNLAGSTTSPKLATSPKRVHVGLHPCLKHLSILLVGCCRLLLAYNQETEAVTNCLKGFGSSFASLLQWERWTTSEGGGSHCHHRDCANFCSFNEYIMIRLLEFLELVWDISDLCHGILYKLNNCFVNEILSISFYWVIDWILWLLFDEQFSFYIK